MQDFTSKRNALFACLDDASKELKGTALDQTSLQSYSVNALGRRQDNSETMSISDTESNHAAIDKSLKRMRGKESLFKKPELPIGRCLKPRRTPDYQINPHKWKKYSLSDVDISDQTNTAAAFAFLKQIDDQKEASTSDQDREQANEKIEFKKSAKIKRNFNTRQSSDLVDPEVDRPRLKGSKLVMPEYVIGHKQQPKGTKRSEAKEQRTRAAGNLKLSHLEDEPEADDE